MVVPAGRGSLSPDGSLLAVALTGAPRSADRARGCGAPRATATRARAPRSASAGSSPGLRSGDWLYFAAAPSASGLPARRPAPVTRPGRCHAPGADARGDGDRPQPPAASTPCLSRSTSPRAAGSRRASRPDRAALDPGEGDHPARAGGAAAGAGRADEHPLVRVAPARQQPAAVRRPGEAREAPSAVEQAPGRASRRAAPTPRRPRRPPPRRCARRDGATAPGPRARRQGSSPAARPRDRRTLTSPGRAPPAGSRRAVHSRSRTAPPAATDHRVAPAVHVARDDPPVAVPSSPRTPPPAARPASPAPPARPAARSPLPSPATTRTRATLQVCHPVAVTGRPGGMADRPRAARSTSERCRRAPRRRGAARARPPT